jgi:hypothetical protein
MLILNLMLPPLLIVILASVLMLMLVEAMLGVQC